VKALKLQADIAAKKLTVEEAVRIYSTLNLKQIPVGLDEILREEAKEKGGQSERTVDLVCNELSAANEYSTLKELYRELESFGSLNIIAEGYLGIAKNKIADFFFVKYGIRDDEEKKS